MTRSRCSQAGGAVLGVPAWKALLMSMDGVENLRRVLSRRLTGVRRLILDLGNAHDEFGHGPTELEFEDVVLTVSTGKMRTTSWSGPVDCRRRPSILRSSPTMTCGTLDCGPGRSAEPAASKCGAMSTKTLACCLPSTLQTASCSSWTTPTFGSSAEGTIVGTCRTSRRLSSSQDRQASRSAMLTCSARVA